MKAKANCLFEVSWEVCNKVGGIYTVIQSKTAQIMGYYDNLFLIGPYFHDKAETEFSQEPPSENMQKVFDELKKEGIDCYYGEWHIKGRPKVVLIDYFKFMEHKDGIKTRLWDSFKVDSLYSSNEFDEPVVWGWAVGKLIEKFLEIVGCPKVVVHCHEWLAGSPILYLKDKGVKVGTVFTTHATILGRSLAASERPLYDILDKIDPDQEARNLHIQDKFTMERATAQAADIFTTVSEITGLEAEHLLKRKPEFLVHNGMDIENLPNLEQIPSRHSNYKSKISEFVMPYFFPYYAFDLENTLYFLISGRYEFSNKGIDVFIESLGKLNDRLRAENSDKNIVAFLFIPAACKAIKLDIVKSKALFEDIEDEVDDYMSTVRQKIVYSLANQQLPNKSNVFSEEFLFDMKKHILAFKKKGLPSVVTHDLCADNDIIVKSLIKNGLDNKKENNVKVIFYPTYISSSDGLLDLDYYPAIWGSHLGIFPSYYEPWGYTPLECAAHGVPSITTDLAGFGIFAEKNIKTKENPGIWVIKRRGKTYPEVVSQLTDAMYNYTNLPTKERIQNKITAEHFVRLLDWKNLIINYLEAQNAAMSK
ncbi:MAG: glycogen/starch synthase [Nanoarchaeota archaeon]|nr:glycogen/starch synthase [Nanoarchaeota archaeon]MBU1703914.1 glycogen/starch synthase [Nanoarchaeota archaeon]